MATPEVSAEDDAEEKTIPDLDHSEKALLESLHSNWEIIRELKNKETPQIEFLTIAKWFLEHDDRDSNKTPASSTSELGSATEAVSDQFPSPEPLRLLEQIIQVRNNRVLKCEQERNESSRLFWDTEPGPDADDDNIPDHRPIYYDEFICKLSYPKQRPFDPKSVNLPKRLETLRSFRFRVAIIEELNNDHLYWENYEKNEFPEIWRARIKSKGGYAGFWRYKKADHEKWLQHLRQQELNKAKWSFRYFYAEAGLRRSLRCIILGYPRHMLNDEEKAERDATILHKTCKLVRELPQTLSKGGEKGTSWIGGIDSTK
ncbi:hypothetical protein QBC37DRAFT_406458 [Rhypophila decipiens]|uniref:Uncharacterized protein n=1 Tax=Rhypophila decipiens TaxID=261697 RepID=A0AAN7AZH1_9PEZI|nr:hypothetical protein QBC37DRAFT_406458 [Rhypophila decipiens]